jgi:transposase
MIPLVGVETETAMRGSDGRTGSLFSYVDLEDRVPAKHPLRLIRGIVNDVLVALDPEFAKIYAAGGRPSIPPERLLRALLLQAFYTIRSETQLMEQLDYNLLYRWFVGLGVDEAVWVPTVFTKNRDRLLEAEVARKFLVELLDHQEVRGLLSDEHFSVDGTQVAAWASMKSFKAKNGSSDPPGPGRNGERDFHGEKRSNSTHASTTDPEAQLFRKGRGKEAKLSFMGHALMENRSGLVVATTVTKATGTAERKAAEEMIVRHSPGVRRITLGCDKGYDAASFVADMRALNVTPHIAQNISGRRSAIDSRTTRHPGYAVSQRKRKRIEEPFGWGKTIGGLARPMLRGVEKLRFKFTLTMAGYNLIRPPRAACGMNDNARTRKPPSMVHNREHRAGFQTSVPFQKPQISAAC